MTNKVRVSMWPDRDVEVDDDEYARLKSHGLLLQTFEEASTVPVSEDSPVRPKPAAKPHNKKDED